MPSVVGQQVTIGTLPDPDDVLLNIFKFLFCPKIIISMQVSGEN